MIRRFGRKRDLENLANRLQKRKDIRDAAELPRILSSSEALQILAVECTITIFSELIATKDIHAFDRLKDIHAWNMAQGLDDVQENLHDPVDGEDRLHCGTFMRTRQKIIRCLVLSLQFLFPMSLKPRIQLMTEALQMLS